MFLWEILVIFFFMFEAFVFQETRTPHVEGSEDKEMNLEIINEVHK